MPTIHLGLRVYRNYHRNCNTWRHKRSAIPTYRYRPHLSSCESLPSSTTAAAAVADDNNCEESRQIAATGPKLRSQISTTSSSSTRESTSSIPPNLDTQSSSGLVGLHKHLLLVTGQVYHEFIGECSIAVQVRDLQHLGSMLQKPGTAKDAANVFVVVQVGTGWRLNVRLLDVLVDRLSNVSMYVDKKYYSKMMTKHCRNISPSCTLLTNLVPVVEQLEFGTIPPVEVDESSGIMYDPNWIPVPALPPLPRNFTGSTEKQIEYLTWRLCVRDRRHNLYYKLDEDSPLSTLRYTQSETSDFRNPLVIDHVTTSYFIVLFSYY